MMPASSRPGIEDASCWISVRFSLLARSSRGCAFEHGVDRPSGQRMMGGGVAYSVPRAARRNAVPWAIAARVALASLIALSSMKSWTTPS
jgi:hypothetical protein